MNFATLAPGTAVFLDANVFVYSITNNPTYGSACSALLQRIDGGDLIGHTSAAVLNDVAHRVLTVEATDVLGWPYQGIARRLRRHVDEVRKLTRFRSAIIQIAQSRISIATVSSQMVVRATELSGLYGVLCNDALILAVMETIGVSLVASADSDFDHVTAITRVAPL